MGIISIFCVLLLVIFIAFTMWLYINYPYLLTFIIIGWFGFYILFQSFKKDKQ